MILIWKLVISHIFSPKNPGGISCWRGDPLIGPKLSQCHWSPQSPTPSNARQAGLQRDFRLTVTCDQRERCDFYNRVHIWYMIYDIYIYIYLGPPNTINIKVLKIMVQVQNTILWVHGGSRQLYSKESSCFHCLGKFGNIRKSPSYDFDGVSHFLQETPWFWLYKPNSVGAGPQPCK